MHLTIENAIRITAEVAGALTAAHETGVLHRDIKPSNILLEAGHAWGKANLDFSYELQAEPKKELQVVMNGNEAVALGVVASGMWVCAMYPITPATSASHYLSEICHTVGGYVHQAEDEIAACAFAIGASYAGQCAGQLRQDAQGLPQRHQLARADALHGDGCGYAVDLGRPVQQLAQLTQAATVTC